MTVDVTRWRGLKNKVDPHILGLTGFTSADNVRVDATGQKLFARVGQTELNTTNYRGAYGTTDKSRGYAITAAGALIQYPNTTLRSGFVGEPYWAELNDFVIVGNQYQTWRIDMAGQVTDNAIPRPAAPLLSATFGNLPAGVYRVVVCDIDREESAPSDESSIELDGTQNLYIQAPGQRIYVCPANSTAFFEWLGSGIYTGRKELLGPQLRTLGLLPMPNGDCVTFYQGALYSSTYMQQQDMSVIWRSKGLWHGLADVKQDIRLIGGEVRMLQGHGQGLLVGTDKEIGSITDAGYVKLADYGVAPGRPAAVDQNGNIHAITQRGFISAFPFAEITPDFAPPQCDFVSAAILREGGDTYLVAMASPTDDPDNPGEVIATAVDLSYLLMSGQGGYLLTADNLRIRIT